MIKKDSKAIALLVGSTIGVGIFGIPFVISKVGFIPGILFLLILGAVNLLVNLIYGEVILRTPGDHQLAGYGEIYLGKAGKTIASLSHLLGIYGALWAYLIKAGEFLALIFHSPHLTFFSLVFFVLVSIAIIFGLKTISLAELFLVGLILSFIASLALISLPHLSPANLTRPFFDSRFLFLPYGVILFALTGASAVPEMEEILRRQHLKLKKTVIVGSLIPVLIYLLFALTIVGISGPKTSDDAIGGLIAILPRWIVDLGAGLGILTMTTSFLSLGYVLKEVWHRDFKLPEPVALGLACLPPLILFLLGAKNFIAILEMTGAITVGLSGLLILLLYRKARLTGQKEPAYQLKVPSAILWLLGLIFLLGIFSPWL